jgi:hypothetical protein
MANPVLADLTSNVTKANGAMESATVLINGFKTKLDAAVAAAIANGATADELAPLQALSTALSNDADALAAAVAANP